MEKTDTHQELMNEFYDLWKSEKGKGKSQKELLEIVPEKVRFAVVLGNLNYQVENGGWHQWVDNGYATSCFDIVVEALETINTEHSPKVLKMVLELEEYLNFEETRDGCFGDYWIMEHEETETCWECSGTGEVENFDDEDETETCNVCGGEGENYYEPESKGWEVAERNNTPYYKFNEKFMAELEDYFSE